MLTRSEAEVLSSAIEDFTGGLNKLVSLQDQLMARGLTLNVDRFEDEEQRQKHTDMYYGEFASLNGWVTLVQACGHQIETCREQLVKQQTRQLEVSGSVMSSEEPRPVQVSGANNPRTT